MMDERERIGKRIAELRRQKGLSQAKLAELTGIDPGHIARIELGRYSTGIDILAKIGHALGCRVDFIEINRLVKVPGLIKSGTKIGTV